MTRTNFTNETAPSAETAGVVRAAIGRLNRRLRAQEVPGGIGSTALSVLGRLYRDGAATMGVLAAEERLQPQSLTRTISDLETRAFVTRQRDDLDRRRASIAITEAGTKRLLESVQRRNAWFARVMATELSETERDFLRLAATLLQRLADAAEPDLDP